MARSVVGSQFSRKTSTVSEWIALARKTYLGLRVCPLKPVSLWRSADLHKAPQPPRWHRAVWERQRGRKLGWRLGSIKLGLAGGAGTWGPSRLWSSGV